MLRTFDKMQEQINGLETDYIKLLTYDLPPNFTDVYQSRSYPRFCTILSGEKEVIIDQSSPLVYSQNQHLLLPPHSNVLMKMEKPTKALVLELNHDLIEQVLRKTPLDKAGQDKLKKSVHHDVQVGYNHQGIAEELLKIYQLSTMKSGGQTFLIDLAAQKLVYELVQDQQVQEMLQTRYPAKIERMIDYIEEMIHEKINLEQLAKDNHMSAASLTQLFKKHTGMLPLAFIKCRKMQLASSYLKEHSVTEVAFMLGFESLSHFIRVFRETYGLTPKQYQLHRS
ncbi:helix-turn-helix domain-containing protein [Tindallia californiensis]|uniref:AraC-type DNA-binding protein n=1 Tax=Tindallia californiensis TaxID=159292 RepID=A0A1H3PW16_9FIRM|nr:helix-turn-helix domain-containing protein [Tindallia californiensis]SDZ05317.1 AraC-type DNA-binding protein [Tindallia californiensis]